MDKLELYIELLKKMDWYWRQSDDSRFLEKNMRIENEMQKLRQEIDKNDIIYKKYCPYDSQSSSKPI